MTFKLDPGNLQKPDFNEGPLDNGIHEVEIELCEYTKSTQGNNMLKIQYKTLDGGRFIFDQIMDDPTKQVNAYRLGRLLYALGIELKGEVELRDMTKIIKKGMRLKVAIYTKPGGTFTNIDINQHEGYYPYKEEAVQITEVELDTPENDAQPISITEIDETY